MKNYSEQVSERINSLLKKSNDAEKGFETAHENVDNPQLKSFFERKAKERKEFGLALKGEISMYGQEVKQSGTFAGAAHRTWMNAISILSFSNEASMLEEAINGEKSFLDEYNEILEEKTLPRSTQSLLIDQKTTLKRDIETIKKLEDLNLLVE